MDRLAKTWLARTLAQLLAKLTARRREARRSAATSGRSNLPGTPEWRADVGIWLLQPWQ